MGVDSISKEELAFFEEFVGFINALSDYSGTVAAPNNEPRGVSLMLFARLSSNVRGFDLLWRAGRALEAAIVLRSALETAICISANTSMGADFYPLLLGDLVATLKGMIKRYREEQYDALIPGYEELVRQYAPRAPQPALKFDWKNLAEAGGIPQLYGYHRTLSAVSSHVTALSIMRGVVGIDGAAFELQNERARLDRAGHMRQMMMAMDIGGRFHARTLEAPEWIEATNEYNGRLTELSHQWRD